MRSQSVLPAIASLAIVSFALATPTHAQATHSGMAATTAASPAGEWDANYNTPGGARAFKVELKADGTKLTGTVKRPTGDVPLTGVIVGDSVKFTYTITYNDNALAMNVAAKVSGGEMKGIVDFAGQAQEEFWATRAKPATDKKPGGSR